MEIDALSSPPKMFRFMARFLRRLITWPSLFGSLSADDSLSDFFGGGRRLKSFRNCNGENFRECFPIRKVFHDGKSFLQIIGLNELREAATY